MKKKHWAILTSTILALIWCGISLFCFIDVSVSANSTDFAEAIGSSIGIALVTPYMITAIVGTVLHTIGCFAYKKNLYLAGVIVESVSILLMPTWSFGYILVIIFGYIGYAKMRKELQQ